VTRSRLVTEFAWKYQSVLSFTALRLTEPRSADFPLLVAVPLQTRIKEWFLKCLGAFTGRHAVLLAREAGREAEILRLSTAYRVTDGQLIVRYEEPQAGRLQIAVLGYEGHFPTRTVFTSESITYSGPATLRFETSTGVISLGDKVVGTVPTPVPTRRFCLQHDLHVEGIKISRLTSHYIPEDGKRIAQDYFNGSNYVDHEAQSSGEHATVVRLLKEHQFQGKVFELGCATGGLLATLEKLGTEAHGVDISEWAVEQANKRVGKQRASVCDVENENLPSSLTAAAPFGALVLWAVFEHFSDPVAVMKKLEPLSRPGTLLLLNTTNADSLTRFLFRNDWEGHYDYSHFGVEIVGVDYIRRELPKLGWRIRSLDTHQIWDRNADPTHACLRDIWDMDARFRRLIIERELGDMILCVAEKK